MKDTVQQFRDAIQTAGMEPPDVIVPSKFHRFPGISKGKGNKAGWCILFADDLGGCFGDWSSDWKKIWRAELDRQFTQLERDTYKRNVEESRKREKEERQQQYSEAAKVAASTWENSKPAPDDHPYLARKGIKAHGIRMQEDGRLVVPVCKDRKIQSVQLIATDGDKKFLPGSRVKGGFYQLGKIQDAEAVCVCEGFATCATVREATGLPVVIAFNSGNLELVAKAVRQKFPELPIVICADDDAHTEGNPGHTFAYKAARAIGAKVAIPVFQAPRPEGASDFNDMARQVGSKEVAKVINAAKQPGLESENNNWSDPQPLIAMLEPEPYPFDALPDSIRNAVEEVHGFIKAPIPLVASSALSAVSLVVQAHIDVKRAEHLEGPASLYFLTIADSGERKSTCDRYFMQSIRDYETRQREAARQDIAGYKAALESWEGPVQRSHRKDPEGIQGC